MAIFSAIASGIAWLGGFLSAAAGLSISTAVTIGTIAGQIGGALVALGISKLLTPKFSVPQQEVQALINQSDAPRRVYVGKNLAGGVRAFYHARDGVLHQVVVVSHGRIEGFEALWVDGERASVSGTSVTGGTTAGYVEVDTRDGSGIGGDYEPMMDTFPGVWTAQHRLQDQATFYVAMTAPDAEDFSKSFPKGYNTVFQYVIKGQRVFDYRTWSFGYSDNAALVIDHYLRHPDGFRLKAWEINQDSVKEMADVADKRIPRKAGGTSPSLRLWGHWTLDEEPASVLDRMHGSSGIRAYEDQDGLIGLIGGNFGQPACTLTAKDIAEIRTFSAVNEREGYNVLRVFFMAEAQKFELAEVEPWRDRARLEQEGEVVTEYQMVMCPDQSQARRLAKKQMSNDNRARVEIITNLVGLKARYPKRHGQRHTIRLDYRPEDGSGREIVGEYEVMDHEFDPVELRCRIVLEKVDRASETWSPSEEGKLIVVAEAPGLSPPPPLVATAFQRTITTEGGGKQSSIRVVATAVPKRPDLKVQAQYVRTDEIVVVGPFQTPWAAMTGGKLVVDTPYLEEGVNYTIRARWSGVFDGSAEWQSLGTITIVSDPGATPAPTDLIGSVPVANYVHLSWRNPSVRFQGIRVYRGTTSIFANATPLAGLVGGVPGQISETSENINTSTTRYYWLVAVNGSGIESSPTGPVVVGG